jgi:hypothetical protein
MVTGVGWAASLLGQDHPRSKRTCSFGCPIGGSVVNNDHLVNFTLLLHLQQWRQAAAKEGSTVVSRHDRCNLWLAGR